MRGRKQVLCRSDADEWRTIYGYATAGKVTTVDWLAIFETQSRNVVMNYQRIITIEPGKRSGLPCVRGLRIAVSDVLGWLAVGISHQEILDDYPELTEEDLRACIAYAADHERRAVTAT